MDNSEFENMKILESFAKDAYELGLSGKPFKESITEEAITLPKFIEEKFSDVDITDEMGEFFSDTAKLANMLDKFRRAAYEQGIKERHRRSPNSRLMNFLTFGRSAHDGVLELYFSEEDNSKEGKDLLCGCTVSRSDGGLNNLVNHVKTQIEYNTPYNSPVAVFESFAVTIKEAKALLSALEKLRDGDTLIDTNEQITAI